MFTGIIQTLGRVRKIETLPLASASAGSTGAGSARLSVEFEKGSSDTTLPASGESIAVNGVCLTVTELEASASPVCVHFFVSPETMARTNFAHLRAESRVNLERALLMSERLSGHVVQGHVDGLAKLVAITPHSGAHALRFELPQGLLRYCVEKGSIALDGVSLTINAISAQSRMIEVMLIPHTWEHTRFKEMKVGESANLEVDVFAKYVEALAAPYGGHRS